VLNVDERHCLDALELERPTTLKAAELMIPQIAHAYGDHSQLCRSLHTHNAVAHTIYTNMWETSPGAAFVAETGPQGIMPVHQRYKMPEYAPQKDPIRGDDAKEVAQGHETNVYEIGEKATFKAASELISAHTKEKVELILKAPPLGSVWTILFADRAERTIRRLARKNQGVLIPVLKNIRMVSDGQWTTSVATTLVAENKKTVLYECKVLNNVRIVWQVDVAYLEAIKAHSQVIKVWCIGNHEDVKKTVVYVTTVHRSYTKDHIDRCEFQIVKDGIVHPKVWPDKGEDDNHLVKVDDYFGLSVSEALRLHEMAVTAKFIPLSKVRLEERMLRVLSLY
jgi:hypothetical protein